MAANEELERLVVLMAGEDVEHQRLLTSRQSDGVLFLKESHTEKGRIR